MLFAHNACIASAFDAEKKNNTTDSKALLKICVYFANFINCVTISTFISSSIWSYLHLVEGYLLFVLKAIVGDNKINFKDNSKIIILTIILYKVMQNWDREINKIIEIENLENKKKKIKGKKYLRAGPIDRCLIHILLISDQSPANIQGSLYIIIKNVNIAKYSYF